MNEAKENYKPSSQSLTRGIQILECLSEFPNGCTLAKIAEYTAINKSTVHRILGALHKLGYATPTQTSGSYRLTSRMASVGFKAYSSLNIIGVAIPYLEKLNLETGNTVNFTSREGDHCILIYKFDPTTGGLRTHAYIGKRIELYCSAMGKLYLAFSPSEFFEKYWNSNKNKIKRLTPSTITDLKKMRKELSDIQKSKCSFDREENELGVQCVAAPVFDIYGHVNYALSVSFPSAISSSSYLHEAAIHVQNTARNITIELGGAF